MERPGGEETDLDDSELQATVTGAGPRVAPGALSAGEQVARYTVVGELGRGGMGVVYRAYDPELDRMVALKLLPVGAETDDASSAARDRLRREAQALAQLSHPNVVAVHDVGDCDAGVYVAMELVEGETVRDWSRAGERDWRDAVRVLASAGQGLAAAHRANLVHRDIKPANIIIAADGSVKVIDFGLARATEDWLADSGAHDDVAVARQTPLPARDDEPSPSATDSGSTPLGSNLTQTGAVMGSPRYMSPEQHLGRPVGPASDQFSFCVTLYELLYRQPPFAGDTRAELTVQVTQGKLREPTHGAAIPSRIAKALRRGLSTQIEDRYPTMDALLEDITADPWSKRRWLVAAALAVVGMGAAAWIGASAGDAPAPLCNAGAERFAAVWSPERAQVLEQAFVASGNHHAASTSALVGEAIARYGQRWAESYTSACEATHVRGEQSPQLLDQRMRCLDRGLDRTDNLLSTLESSPSAEIVDRAVQIVGAEASPVDCLGDPSALMAETALPRDPAQRTKITAARAALDRGRAAFAAGRYDEAVATFAKVVPDANALGFAPLQGDASYWLARAEQHAGRPADAEARLREGFELAAKTADDWLAAKMWIALLNTMRQDQARADATLALVPFVKAAIVRVGSPAELDLELTNLLGILRVSRGDYEGARPLFERRLELAEKRYGADHLDSGMARTNLGLLLYYQGEYDKARLLLSSALQTLRKRVGEEHPSTSTVRMNLAITLRGLEDLDGAIRELEQVVAVRKRSLGPTHPKTGTALQNLGDTLVENRSPEPALPILREALAIVEQAHGPDHVEVGWPLVSLAKALRSTGAFGEAKAHLERALDVRGAALGADHPDVAAVLHHLGAVADDLDQADQARRYLERALRLREASLGLDHPSVASSRLALAEHHLRHRRPAEAVPLLEAILAIENLTEATHALAGFGMARAKWQLGSDRPWALRTARSARAVLDRQGRDADARDIANWLASVSPP